MFREIKVEKPTSFGLQLIRSGPENEIQSGNAGGESTSTAPARREDENANRESVKDLSNEMDIPVVAKDGHDMMSEQETAFMDKVWEQRISCVHCLYISTTFYFHPMWSIDILTAILLWSGS